ncbi:hypothetical protein T11_862 [Trichinella zimbabwensis]|uniref:Retrovirus-related Pol polyprotein from transposon TNT 1-94 n=1 Tax=Trichinella zimbabwensis TaxID=268475 RepID=A0A0V1I2V7_9BILA|nr:hypothetical protein T11_862 [Trichinella zimbabwensis]
MDEETRALHMNSTWILTDLPPDQKTTMANFNGVVNKYKAHLFAKEFSQRREIDYMETYTSRKTPRQLIE